MLAAESLHATRTIFLERVGIFHMRLGCLRPCFWNTVAVHYYSRFGYELLSRKGSNTSDGRGRRIHSK